MKRFFRIILPVLTFCAIAFILLNAFSDGTQATEKRDVVVKVVTGQASFATRVMRTIAKFFHVLEYAFYSFALTSSILIWGDLRARLERVLLCGIFLALADELIQSTLSGRGSRVTDIVVDTAGIMLGYAASVLIAAVVKRIQKKKGT